MRDGKPREASVFLHHKLGHRVPVSVRTSPVREASGAIVGAIEIFTDNSKALEILKELEGLKQEAYLDKLTNVGNRRYGENTLGTCIFQWQSHGTSFGVIFLDIDYFKKLNDSAGHKAGDDMLVMVGQTILNTVRRFDIVSRWGGEEFVVILPSITAELLTVVAERIRVFIESSFIMADDRKLSITASLGATLVEPDDTPETIVHRADTLMYASKTAGRNRVTIG
jgi:diguanylate cyclase (GGDEF)-like protein